MRVEITIDPQDPHRDLVREDAEFWLGNRARAAWRVREDEDLNGREVLTFEFTDPLDAFDFHHRIAHAEHRGKLV
ncbi:hypothetical protein E2C06_34675 [Dankookia rubra]|uniref:Uncharacterized protein n=1 Tax=Dankookia rubra TaxID=1442381 RepID=A0A4R5Q7I8_9PROT|nr:hypothetical protein [Dankookia rubra]TDH58047.1 hypothetical protein E2C06_34675 [Dankookia rubra]